MKYSIQVSVIIFAIYWCEIVKCSPHPFSKAIQKSFQFEIRPIAFPQLSVLLEKITPFGRFEFKHAIKKRQIAQTETASLSNEIPVNVGEAVNVVDTVKLIKPGNEIFNENLFPQVIITSLIEPVEDDKPMSVILPLSTKEVEPPVVDSFKEVVPPVEIVPPEVEVKAQEENIASSSELTVILVTPKPELIPPPLPPSIPVLKESVDASIQGSLPPRVQFPIFRNLNGLGVRPIINTITNRPLLFTDIKPFIGLPYPTPVIPVPEVIIPQPPMILPPPPPPLPPPENFPPQLPLPPPPPPAISPLPPPPPIVEVIKEERPNFLVKGSRFVLYFGSMMLQMLSQLVNGRINLEQPIDIPILAGA